VSGEELGRRIWLIDSKLHYVLRIRYSRISDIDVRSEQWGVCSKTDNLYEGWVGGGSGMKYKETSADEMVRGCC
jgi:hypothetical protein